MDAYTQRIVRLEDKVKALENYVRILWAVAAVLSLGIILVIALK
jgi:hypothetical protein